MNHGTYIAYKDGRTQCRCAPCTEASRRQHIMYLLRRTANGGEPLLVPAETAMRQLRHLRLLGYDSRTLAAHSGMNNGHILQVSYGRWKTIAPTTAAKVARMFLDLKDFPGPSKTATTFAKKAGYALIEDDSTLDLDPVVDQVAIERFIAGDRTVPLTQHERDTAIHLLHERGYYVYQISDTLHMNVARIKRVLAGEPKKKRGPKKAAAA